MDEARLETELHHIDSRIRRLEEIEEDRGTIKPKYLPCPFCGHKDIKIITTSLQNYQKFECFCHSCGIPGPGSRDKSRAIASWNRRV